MFEELSELLRGTPKKALTDIEVGKLLDLLRQLPHFQQLNSKFGADYLVLMLPTLQPFILREGFMLFGQSDHYLLVDGELSEEEVKYEASRPIHVGKKIDPSERQGVRFLAKSDCKMIKIKRGPSAGFQIERKLYILEKERKRSLTEMRMILGGQNYKEKYEFLQKIPYFESLGQFDFLDLAAKSYIQQFTKGSSTHKHGEIVKKIGCIIAGKIKLNYPIDNSDSSRGKGIQMFKSQGDWLGLQQLLWKQDYQTSGEASTIVAMVVWIPKDTFQCKFNQKTNYQLVCRLKGAIEVKKLILEKSIKCRRSKIMDIQQQMRAEKAMNAKLVEKISTLQFINDRKRTNFRKTKNGKDIQIPQLVLHRVNFSSEPLDPSSLPNIMQKLNLFPEQYQETPISGTHLKQMKRLESNKNRSVEPKRHRTFLQKNPEQLYETILEKIPRKLHETSSLFLKTARQDKPGVHYNMSIYNNFRVSKQRNRSPTVRTFRTLDLFPNQQ